MKTAEFTLRLIALQSDVHQRLEAISEFLTIYDITEKKPVPPIFDTELQFKQHAQDLAGGQLPKDHTLS